MQQKHPNKFADSMNGWSTYLFSNKLLCGAYNKALDNRVTRNFLPQVHGAYQGLKLISKYIANKDLLRLIIAPSIITTISSITLSLTSSYLSGRYEANKNELYNMANENTVDSYVQSLSWSILYWLIISTVKTLANAAFNYKVDMNRLELQNITADFIRTLSFDETTQPLLALKSNEQTQALYPNFRKDVALVINSSFENLTGTVKNLCFTFISATALWGQSPVLCFAPLILGLAQFQTSSYFQKKKTGVALMISNELSRTRSIIEYDYSLIRSVFESQSSKSILGMYRRIDDALKELITRDTQIRHMKTALDSVFLDLTNALKLLTPLYLTYNNIVNVKLFGMLMSHLDDVGSFIRFCSTSSLDNGNAIAAFGRVNIYLEVLEQAMKKPNNMVKYNENTNNIVVTNLSMSTPGYNGNEPKRICNIPSLSLERGRRHVFFGCNGAGKSSLLTKMAGIVNDPIQLSEEAAISLPCAGRSKVVMIPQQDHIRIGSTLLEIICSPNEVPTIPGEKRRLIKRVNYLMGQCLFDGTSNWSKNLGKKVTSPEQLSGGQKKKVKIISAILQKPDILLLDETFAGIDTQRSEGRDDSLSRVLNLIETELPDATIVAVDHEWESHNAGDFYNGKKVMFAYGGVAIFEKHERKSNGPVPMSRTSSGKVELDLQSTGSSDGYMVTPPQPLIRDTSGKNISRSSSSLQASTMLSGQSVDCNPQPISRTSSGKQSLTSTPQRSRASSIAFSSGQSGSLALE